jgi:hypothetical protein
LRAHAGSGPNASNRAALRYGPGLYFSSTSGKSNDYATHSERLRGSRRWRTMFVATVAAGRAYCTHEAELDVTRPRGAHPFTVSLVSSRPDFFS